MVEGGHRIPRPEALSYLTDTKVRAPQATHRLWHLICTSFCARCHQNTEAVLLEALRMVDTSGDNTRDPRRLPPSRKGLGDTQGLYHQCGFSWDLTGKFSE